MPIIIGSLVCVSNESKPNTAAAIRSQTHSFKTNCFIVPCFLCKGRCYLCGLSSQQQKNIRKESRTRWWVWFSLFITMCDYLIEVGRTKRTCGRSRRAKPLLGNGRAFEHFGTKLSACVPYLTIRARGSGSPAW